MSIFKSRDIRGIYPKDLSEEIAYLLGQNIVKKTKAKTIVIGQDARLSSPPLFQALAKGINSQNCDIYYIGLTATELIYFALTNYNFSAGIMITASHNPKEYNGFKMLVKDKNNIKIIKGEEMKNLKPLKEKQRGKIIKFNPYQNYLKHINSFWNKKIKQKIVVDAGNGVAGIILKKLNLNIIPFNFEPDGNFPSGGSNPLESIRIKRIKEVIKKEQADFGFMFDGDADRIFLVNNKGEMINADVCLLALAKKFLEKEAFPIVYNTFASRAVPELIKKWKGKPIKSKVGYTHIREKMIKHQAILGGEHSAHYCFKDNNFFDSGIIAFLMLLDFLEKEKFPQLPYFKSKEINLKIEKKQELIKKLSQKYKKEEQSFLDGISVSAKNWWFCARPSQTEPLMRLMIEANTKKLLQEKKKELKGIMQDPYFS